MSTNDHKKSVKLVVGKPSIPLDVSVEPRRGRVDLSHHQGGGSGFKNVIEDCTKSLSSYQRRKLQLEEKVVLVGDLCVGKTSLLQSYINNSYKHDYEPTIGVDFHKQRYTYAGIDFTLHILDIAGQECYQVSSNHFYKGAQACIAVFDLGQSKTLTNIKQWVDRIRKDNLSSKDDICVFLVGCKSDMFHTISDIQVERFATELHAEYFEVSAKTGLNVKQLFNKVAMVMFERALLRQVSELQRNDNDSKSDTIRLLPKDQRDSSDDDLLIDTGAGKGTVDWKRIGKSSKKTQCCGIL